MSKNSEYQKKWYEKNKATQIARNELNKKKKRIYFRKYKTDRGCLYCGEKHPSCLQFHHKNPEEKEFLIHELIAKNLSIDNIMKEVNKCEVVCANCHFKIHWKSDIDNALESDIIEV